jgi:hypothetical protein
VTIPDHLAAFPWYEPHQRWLWNEEGGVRANFRGADLIDANLTGADLTDANLIGADLRGADLTDANLNGANLTGAAGVIDAGTPHGWRVVGWLRDGWLSVRVGCHDIRLPDAREYWHESHPRWEDRQEIPPALDYVEAVARVRGWRVEEAS